MIKLESKDGVITEDLIIKFLDKLLKSLQKREAQAAVLKLRKQDPKLAAELEKLIQQHGVVREMIRERIV